jgi:4-diphosphocytidyl-2-C-methyl-D-erythritol kinase
LKLTALAPGKINLCLFLGGPRGDGRHELVTLIESVSLADELSAATAPDERPDEVICPGIEEPNLVAAALAGLRERGWRGPSLRVEIAKRIPVAAGMGGGSADAAAMLRLAAELEAVPPDSLAALAAELGADVPSQLEPGVVIGTGAGDEVFSVAALRPHALVIVPSEHRLSTADVYAEADRICVQRGSGELAALHERLVASLQRDGQPPAELIGNDLERAATSLCPDINRALDAVRDAGADHALVSGSGPTVFGVFWGEQSSDRAEAAGRAVSGSFKDAVSAVPVGAGAGHPHVSAQSRQDR